MSDSEDEFASADEGEMATNKLDHPGTQKGGVKENKTSPPGKTTADKDDDVTGKTGEDTSNPTTSTKTPKQASQSDEKTSTSGAKGKQSGKNKKGKNKGANKTNNKPTDKKKQEKSETSAKKVEQVEAVGGVDVESTGVEGEVVKSDVNKVNDKVVSTGEPSTVTTQEDKPGDNITFVNNVKSGSGDSVETPTKSDLNNSAQTLDNGVQTLDNGAQTLDNSAQTPVKSDTNDPVVTPVKSGEAGASGGVDQVQSPSTQSIPRPDPDHTREQENVLTKLAEAAQEKPSSWSWGWGSSLLNIASNSVTTFTSQVGEGINTVMETVESTLNVPSPEDLVEKTQTDRQQATDSAQTQDKQADQQSGQAQDKQADTDDSQDEGSAPGQTEPTGASSADMKGREPEVSDSQSVQDSSNSWFSSWGVGNITKMVESTGKTLVTGSLDVLETLGKKTFDAINEHDPGLKKTRGMLKERGDKPNLSAVLRDARDHHEERVKQEQESEEARKAHFGTLFDEFQGLAHLEALEMLSNQSEKKVNSLITALPPDVMAALKPQLLEVKGHFEINEEDEEEIDDHDFTKLVSDIYTQLNVGTLPDKLTRVQEKIRQSLTDFEDKNSSNEKALSKDVLRVSIQGLVEFTSKCMEQFHKDVFRVSIQCLAEFTSKCMEQFHKAGEMVLLQKTQTSDFVSISQHLHSLTKVLCSEVGILSVKFTECLNGSGESEGTVSLNQMVTSVYLEASNSSSYIQDGFQLLLPVLQQAAIEKKQEPES